MLISTDHSCQMSAYDSNALLPTSEQNQAFLSLESDGPIVMVNLLKFKPDGGAQLLRTMG